MSLKIYHNPRCTKSRQTLALLQEAGHDFEVIEYLKNPLTLDQLQALQAVLGLPARQMMRSGEAIYKQLSLATQNDEAALLAAMAEHPILLERPVVRKGQKAVICRPPERIHEVL